jgi:arabinogalactan endo-1,4-beta-galactosidase
MIMPNMKFFISIISLLLFTQCLSYDGPEMDLSNDPFYLGADLSSVNEMEDQNIVFTRGDQTIDPYEFFSHWGMNLVRLRLWHSPTWTEYFTLPDVKKSISRAREQGMTVLLDFHYSDTWADPGSQIPPASWQGSSDEEMAEQLYLYTYETLEALNQQDLLPEMVQLGNEINQGILKSQSDIDWPRQSLLFNAAIAAVHEMEQTSGKSIEIMLHIAGPENAQWWFDKAIEAGIQDFDLIGLSYYPTWSTLGLKQCGSMLSFLAQRYQRQVMIVETGYPWTSEDSIDTADNILNKGLRRYGISKDGQRQFFDDLVDIARESGAIGVVYWEPAWVSTDSPSPWGVGSHWENITWFDFENRLHQSWETP